MTAYLVQLMLDHGYKPAVLSFPDVPIAVCEQRVRGVRQLQRQVEGLDVIILDDAMQHRALRCGYTILLTPYDRLYIDDHMLPYGTLRDLPSRALKADTIVVTKCPEDIRPIDMRVVDNRLHLPTYQHLHFAGITYAPIEQKGTPLVVAGIARPEYLFDHVQKQYPHAELLAFPDHHAFAPADVETILRRAKHFDFVLTTEKDLQRLRLTELEKRLEAQGKQLVPLPIRTHFYTPKEQFDKQILLYIHENRLH